MIPRALLAGTLVLGGFNLAGLVEEERPDKGKPSGPPGSGWVWG